MTDAGRYFDHAACTTPYDNALAASTEAANRFYGNPSSLHSAGKAARDELRRLKEHLCALVGFDDGRLILTSGGTESNNLVINSYLATYPDKAIALAVNAHASMWFPAETVPKRFKIIPVSEDGRLDLDVVKRLDANAVSLCCINHICNETGSIQDVHAVSEICLRHEIPLVVDGVQAMGKLPINLNDILADYYTFSAHKFGGPHGVGGVFSRGDSCRPMVRGGGQEWTLRAGTENLPGLAGAVKAFELSKASCTKRSEHYEALATCLVESLKANQIHVLLNTSPVDFRSGIVSLSFPGQRSQVIAAELALQGFSVATGSACNADTDKPSRVIMALGRPAEEALGTIRISFGRDTTRNDVAELIKAMNVLR